MRWISFIIAAIIKKIQGGVSAMTWNPADIGIYPIVSPTVTLSESNTRVVGNGPPIPNDWYKHVRATAPLTGKVYFELGVIPAGGINANMMGLLDGATSLYNRDTVHTAANAAAGVVTVLCYTFTGQIIINGVLIFTRPLGKLLNGVFMGFHVDIPNSLIYFKDSTGNLNGGDPEAGTGGTPLPPFGTKGIYIYGGPQRAADGVDFNNADKPAKFTIATGFTRV